MFIYEIIVELSAIGVCVYLFYLNRNLKARVSELNDKYIDEKYERELAEAQLDTLKARLRYLLEEYEE